LPALSVSLTVCEPAVAAGTVNVTPAGIDPALEVVGVAGLSVNAPPSQVADRFDDPANPLPDTVTVTAVLPDNGDKLMNELTVKLALAVWPPTLNCTVCEPLVAAGTVNVVPENEPFASVVVELIDNAPPSHVALADVFAGNADPDTVTVAPTFPDVGSKLIDRVTVNCVPDTSLFVPSSTATS
jgi:hypothetical protein